MLLTIPQVLDPAQVRHLIAAAWADGKITAGSQSAQQKRNRQLPEDAPMAEEARAIVLAGLAASGLFFTAVLPHKVYPPRFNRYESGGGISARISTTRCAASPPPGSMCAPTFRPRFSFLHRRA